MSIKVAYGLSVVELRENSKYYKGVKLEKEIPENKREIENDIIEIIEKEYLREFNLKMIRIRLEEGDHYRLMSGYGKLGIIPYTIYNKTERMNKEMIYSIDDNFEMKYICRENFDKIYKNTITRKEQLEGKNVILSQLIIKYNKDIRIGIWIGIDIDKHKDIMRGEDDIYEFLSTEETSSETINIIEKKPKIKIEEIKDIKKISK